MYTFVLLISMDFHKIVVNIVDAAYSKVSLIVCKIHAWLNKGGKESGIFSFLRLFSNLVAGSNV